MKKYLLFSIIVFSALWVLSPAPAQAATYYVDSSCTNSGNGAVQNCSASPGGAGPWKTIAEVVTNMPSLGPGDQLLFNGGLTYTSATGLFLANAIGNLNNRVKISTYGSGKATLNITNFQEGGIGLWNCDSVEISNFILIGVDKTQAFYSGLGVGSNAPVGNNMYFHDMEISGFKYGVGFFPSTIVDNLRIEKIKVHDTQVAPANPFIISNAANFYVGYCEAYNNTDNIIAFEIYFSRNGVVEHNIAHDLGNRTSEDPESLFACGFHSNESDSITFQYNEAYNLKGATMGGCGFQFDEGTKNSIMQYNYAHDMDSAGFSVGSGTASKPNSNNIVRYNIAHNVGLMYAEAGLDVWSINGAAVSNIYFYNNTVNITAAAHSWSSGLHIGSWPPSNDVKNITAKNNIFVVANGNPVIKTDLYQTDVTLDYNNLYNTGLFNVRWAGTDYFSLESYKTASGQDIHSLNLDPKFVSAADFKLQTESPCIDAGTNVGLTRDYIGTSVPQGNLPDIGAYEVITTSPDLIVTDISWTPVSPQTGDAVTFGATIKNQGTGSTPAGIIHGVLFVADSQTYVWSDTYTSSLAPGASVTVTANGGSTGMTIWTATAGTHTVEAYVDDVNRITESNENNNTLTETLTVGAADITPPAAPTGVVVN